MKIYFRVFVNKEQNNWERLLLIVEFAYNNAKNINISYTLFEFNYKYYPRVSFKDEINFYLRSYFTKKLVDKLRELIKICYQNLFYV